MDQISIVEAVLNKIPAEIISSRAVACKSYARALFYWEQYIRQRKDSAIQNSEQLDTEPLYQKLQDIYTQIDEPDGIEGISAHLQVLSMDQQVIEHHKAGRWTAVQSWYELLLNEQPGNIDIQVNLLNSLRESGQYGILSSFILLVCNTNSYQDTLLTQAANFSLSEASILTSRPFAVEAAWVTGKWDKLESQLEGVSTEGGIFNVGIGLALLSLRRKDYDGFSQVVDRLQRDAARRLSSSSTSSLQSCHDVLLRLHVLYEIETLSGAVATKTLDRQATTAMLDRRLGILGAFSSDKQYILGVRRAAMALSR